MIEPLLITFELSSPVAHAFHTWTSRIDAWWPKEHTATNDPESTILLECELGGRLFERTTEGIEHDWGRVTEWEPPRRFGYTWHIRRDASDATDVSITFVPIEQARTRVDIVHTGWDRLGAGGQEWRDRNRGGWDGVLPHFIAFEEGSRR